MSHKLLQFLNSSNDLTTAISGTYNLWLVALFVLIASVAAYAALQIAERLSISKTVSVKQCLARFRRYCHGWRNLDHALLGMLAVSLPMAITYDLTITQVSIIPGVLSPASSCCIS